MCNTEDKWKVIITLGIWCKEQDIEEEKIYKNLDHLWVSSKKGETCILFQSGNNADRLQKEKERLERRKRLFSQRDYLISRKHTSS